MKNKYLNFNWQLLGTRFRPIKWLLMDKVALGDKLLVYHSGYSEGIVTLITMKGVGVSCDTEYRFVKWCNVIELIK